MLTILFRKKPKTSDISVNEFSMLMDKFIELAQCAKDPIDTRAKEFLFAAIEMRGIPQAGAYFDEEEEIEIEEEKPSGEVVINRGGAKYALPRKTVFTGD